MKTSNHSVNFSGLKHTPVGNAKLIVDNGEIVVNNICSDNEDGVRVDVGEVQGIVPEIKLSGKNMRSGSYIESKTWGRVEGKPNQLTGVLKMERNKQLIKITPDFTSIGAETYELQLYNNGSRVYRQTGMSGAAGNTTGFLSAGRGRACCRVILYSANFLIPSEFLVSGGPQIMADSAIFIQENPRKKVDFISALTITAKDVSEFSITREEISPFDGFISYIALGDAMLESSEEKLRITNLESNSDGIHVDCTLAESCRVKLEPENKDTYSSDSSIRVITENSSTSKGFEVSLSTSLPRTVGVVNVDNQTTSRDTDCIKTEPAESNAPFSSNFSIMASKIPSITISDETISEAKVVPGTLSELLARVRGSD